MLSLITHYRLCVLLLLNAVLPSREACHEAEQGKQADEGDHLFTLVCLTQMLAQKICWRFDVDPTLSIASIIRQKFSVWLLWSRMPSKEWLKLEKVQHKKKQVSIIQSYI